MASSSSPALLSLLLLVFSAMRVHGRGGEPPLLNGLSVRPISFEEGYTQIFGDANLAVLHGGRRVDLSLDESTGLQAFRLARRSPSAKYFSGKPMLPAAGQFSLVLYPDKQWNPEIYKPVELLFAYRNLYLQGFKIKNTWYMFNDAIIQLPPDPDYQVVRLGFKGSYGALTEEKGKIRVGKYALMRSYRSLALYQQCIHGVKEALATMIIMFAEAWRFPQLKKWIAANMSDMKDRMVDDFDRFSAHFTNTAKYSERLRQGKDKFKPIHATGVATFNQLIGLVAVLLYAAPG